MGRIPTALQGRTAEAPILQLTWPAEVTMMGLTGRRKNGRWVVFCILAPWCVMITYITLHNMDNLCVEYNTNNPAPRVNFFHYFYHYNALNLKTYSPTFFLHAIVQSIHSTLFTLPFLNLFFQFSLYVYFCVSILTVTQLLIWEGVSSWHHKVKC